MTSFSGKAFKYGDNVNTDVIIPARYLNDASLENLKQHVLEDLDAEFCKNVKEGDVIIGGENFGNGSSREHAPIALKAAGVKMIIAKSFARIFFRNCVNIGLYIVESAKISDEISANDTLNVDGAKLINITTGRVYDLPPMDSYVLDILSKGGLLEAIKR